ncbi:MAG: hypothetical protein JO125_17260 [Chloroflexi bacterium]|nr:hypothetical protein [Ktedonobacteraceae bacterium]MBV9021435.1 hypothetical protein [Ktedonobacteraceae bacterium]MBV9709145.1 hypothetical protein [Chloroflexota bacterium]
MANNTKQFRATMRIGGYQVLNGHAMPFTMLSRWWGCDGPMAAVGFVVIVDHAQGNSVPISRGGPPILYE